MTWNARYSVGVTTLDSQHTALFRIVNELYDAMMKAQSRGMTGELLQRLAKYTREHFAFEEKVMASTGYPGLARHRVMHRDLMKQVDDFTARLERGDDSINPQLLRFLSDWLTRHILHDDKEYGPWLNQHGVH